MRARRKERGFRRTRMKKVKTQQQNKKMLMNKESGRTGGRLTNGKRKEHIY